MSFEGYYQILCKNGHYDTCDVYIFDWAETCWECSICKEKVGWMNTVDLTNGSYDDEGRRIDGCVELEVKEQPKECECPTCGNTHSTGPTVYEVPAKPARVEEDEEEHRDICYDYDTEDDEVLGI